MGFSLHRKPGLTFHNPTLSWKGYTLLTPVGGDSTYLIDMAGEVVHRWRFTDVTPEYGFFTDAGTLLVRCAPKSAAPFRPSKEDDPPMPLEERARSLPSNYRYLREVDWDGTTLWEHDDPVLHHDFFQTCRDTVIVTRFVQMEKALSDRVRGSQLSFMLWRAHRYSADHAALAGRDLDPARHRALNAQFGLSA